MLIDVMELSRHGSGTDWIVFDCRHDLFDHEKGARAFRAGHIPGAYFVPFETALAGVKTGSNGRHPLPAASAFADFLNEHGVTAETQIVAYDDVGGQYAARLWWLAGWIGLTRVAVLDGGWPKWVAAGLPVESDVAVPRGGGNVVARPAATLAVPVEKVATAVATGELLVVDARAPERYRGEVEPIDRVAGHIPSARNRFFKANLNADLTMRPAAELRGEFQTLLGGCPAEAVVHQCGSGVTACVNLLAMEHAGLKGSKLFVGSWSEWIADPTRPVAKGES